MSDANGKPQSPPQYFIIDDPDPWVRKCKGAYLALKGHPFHVVADPPKNWFLRVDEDTPRLREALRDFPSSDCRRFGEILSRLSRVVAEEVRRAEKELFDAHGAAKGWDAIAKLRAQHALQEAEDRAATLNARAEKWISSSEYESRESPDGGDV